MFGDPIFLISLLAVFGLIGIWIYQVLQHPLLVFIEFLLMREI